MAAFACLMLSDVLARFQQHLRPVACITFVTKLCFKHAALVKQHAAKSSALAIVHRVWQTRQAVPA